jgi:hypothetical protein
VQAARRTRTVETAEIIQRELVASVRRAGGTATTSSGNVQKKQRQDVTVRLDVERMTEIVRELKALGPI